MKKEEVIERLKALGVEPNEKDNYNDLRSKLKEAEEANLPSPAPGGPCPVFGEFSQGNRGCKNCNKDRNEDYFNACKARTAGQLATQKSSKGGGKKRGHKSERFMYVQDKLSKGKYTRKDIIAMFMTEFPDASKNTVATYLSDGKNPKYNPFPRLIVENKESKVLSFEDA